jgi:hypothetical protein
MIYGLLIMGLSPLFFFAFFNYYLNTFRRILLPYETVFLSVFTPIMNSFRSTPFERKPPSAVAPPNLDTDFPDLPTTSSSSSNRNNCNRSSNRNSNNRNTWSNGEESLNLSRMVETKPAPLREAVVEEVFAPGVVRYTLNKRSKKLTVNESVSDVPDESGKRFIKMHATLQQNYCDHADRFIQCYGYDCYERTFLMPNYDPFGFSDESDWSSDSDGSE